MKFLTNKAELDLKDFQQILTAHNQDFQRKVKLKNYYVGKHDETAQLTVNLSKFTTKKLFAITIQENLL